MSLRFKLLGVLQIENEAGEISEVMKSSKWCALLVYLFVAKAAQPREVLADLLWDATSTAQSLQNLRALLTRLRKLVPELEVTRKQIRYPTETAVDTDYDTLIAGLNSGNHHEIPFVLPLYQGDFLDGFYLENAPQFNEWLLITREKLRQRVVGAFRQLCTLYQEQSDWVKGIAMAQRWLALDELDEVALRHLLQLLAGSGQIDVALQQYQVSRQRLWDELGVEPMDATQELAEQIAKAKETHGDGISWDEVVGTPIRPPAPDELPDVGHLPSRMTVPYQRNPNFVGRQGTLREIGQELLPSDEGKVQRAVAITGMGGLGKTQLAVEFCYRYGRYFPGGVFWLSFTGEKNIAEEVMLIGGENGLGLYRDADGLTQTDKVARVRKAWQAPIPRLLVFDNCEDEALLTQWLPVTGGCRVLVTSRRSVWSPELGIVKSIPLQSLPRSDSVQMLQKLVTDIDVMIADEIAAETGDLPLALYLAGGFLRRYRQVLPAQYLHQLRDKGLLEHPSLQGRGIVHSPTGHELNIARTFALNFKQLNAEDETDQVGLRLLACAIAFAHGEAIPNRLLLACVQSETEDFMLELLAMDGLTRLLMLGILREVGSENVQVHRLIATYAQVELSEAYIVAGRTAVETVLINALTAHLEQEPYLQSLPVIATHILNVAEAAKVHATENTAHLSGLLGYHFLGISDYLQAQKWLELALELAQMHYPTNSLVVATARMRIGRLKLKTADYEMARTYLEQAFGVLEQLDNSATIHLADTQLSLGEVLEKMGELDQAQHHLEKALTTYEQLPNPNVEQVALCYSGLANLSYKRGNYDLILHYNQKVLKARKQFFGAEHRMVGAALSSLGVAYCFLGRVTEGYQYIKQSAEMMERLLGPEHLDLAKPLENLGVLEWRIGDFNTAHRYFRRALQIETKNLPPDHPNIADALNNVGEALCKLGEFEEAEMYHERAMAIRQTKFGVEHYSTVRSLSMLGEVYLRKGAREQAQATLERALAIQDRIEKDPQAISDTLILLGETYLEQGNLAAAEPVLRRALTVREEGYGFDDSETAVARFQVGRWYEASGDVVAARHLYEDALAVLEKTVAESHPYIHQVRALLEKVG